MDWSGVDYLWIIEIFLSAVWTLILTAPIHCRGSIAEQVMQCYISPNLMKKQTHLHLGWPEGEDIFSQFKFLDELFLFIMASSNNPSVYVLYVQGIYYDIFNILLESGVQKMNICFGGAARRMSFVLHPGPDMFTFHYFYVSLEAQTCLWTLQRRSPCGFWKYLCLFYKY